MSRQVIINGSGKKGQNRAILAKYNNIFPCCPNLKFNPKKIDLCKIDNFLRKRMPFRLLSHVQEQ